MEIGKQVSKPPSFPTFIAFMHMDCGRKITDPFLLEAGWGGALHANLNMKEVHAFLH